MTVIPGQHIANLSICPGDMASDVELDQFDKNHYYYVRYTELFFQIINQHKFLSNLRPYLFAGQFQTRSLEDAALANALARFARETVGGAPPHALRH